MALNRSVILSFLLVVACSTPSPQPTPRPPREPIHISTKKQDIRSRAALIKVLEKLAAAETPQVAPEAPWVTQYKAALKSREVSCDLNGESLKYVFSFLSDVSGLNFVVQEPLQAEEVKVRYKAVKAKLGDAIKAILNQCQWKWRFHNEAIHILPSDSESILEFYDVSDIITKVPDYPAPELGLRPGAGGGQVIGVGRGAATRAPRMSLAIYDVQDLVSRVPDFPGPRIQVGEIEKPKKKEAEQKTWKPSTLSPHTLRLKVGDKEELPLESLDVTVQIDAFQARVLVDASFLNPNNRQLEGQFQLRLPSSASPYYLAFGQSKVNFDSKNRTPLPVASDIASTLLARSKEWTAVKEARMVPREQASSAYRSEVKKAVDPALLEWAGADIFRCQVYPLMAEKSHRVVLAYDVPLNRKGKNWVYKLELPKEQTKSGVHIIVRSSKQPKITLPGIFENKNQSWHFDRPSIQARQFEVTIPDSGATVLVDEDPTLGEHFATRIQPKVPEMTDSKQFSRAIFLLDTSSSAKTGFPQRVQLLKSILTDNRDTIKEFAVLFFNIEQYWFHKGFQSNNPGNVDSLLSSVNKTVLEGSTDLEKALDVAHSSPWINSKEQDHCYFLLSDGSASWGRQKQTEILSKIKKQPIYCYKFGFAGTDQSLLGAIARESGGAVITAYNNSELKKAARAHTKTPWTIDRVSVPGSKDLIIGGRAKTLYPGQNILIAGRGKPSGALLIELSSGEQSKRLQFNLREIPSPLATRIYGQCASHQITDITQDSSLAVSFDLLYRIPGRHCSMLMLESEKDYKNHFNFSLKKHLGVVKKTTVQSLQDAARVSSVKTRSQNQFQLLVQSLKKHPKVSIKFAKSAEAVLAQFSRSDLEFKVAPIHCSLRQKGSDGKEDSSKIDWNETALKRHKQGLKGDALRALSAALELERGELDRLRDVTYTALSWHYDLEAATLLREIIDKRPTEFLSYLTMARALAKHKLLKPAIAWFELTLSIQESSKDLRVVTSYQYSKLLTTILASERHSELHPFAKERLSELQAAETPIKKGSLVILSTWNTDSTDVDLHVTEIGGQHCSYNRKRLLSGAWLLGDITTGYGPEQFVHPKPEQYPLKVEVSYFSSNSNRMSTTTRAYLTIFKNWNSEIESVEYFAVTLRKSKEKQWITTLSEP